jgi:2-phospho-L-lactate guanylyltransferase
VTLWAIVPVKPLRRSKSRLSGVLSVEERTHLSQELLTHTLDVLREVPEVEHTLVISRDSAALSVARDFGARTVQENGMPELNRALIRATLVARGYGVSRVLILPADLPLISRNDVEQLLSMAHDPPVVVVAPDRHGRGTNALISAPPGLIEYDFGPDSFARHVARAEASGARLEICRLPSLALDVDMPEDLEILRSEQGQPIKAAEEIPGP